MEWYHWILAYILMILPLAKFFYHFTDFAFGRNSGPDDAEGALVCATFWIIILPLWILAVVFLGLSYFKDWYLAFIVWNPLKKGKG